MSGDLYGPSNPPRLKRPGETLEEYRVALGWDKPKAGGRREGSGRKALDQQGTIVTTIRLTGEQLATFRMLGGVEWLRDQLQRVIEGERR